MTAFTNYLEAQSRPGEPTPEFAVALGVEGSTGQTVALAAEPGTQAMKVFVQGGQLTFTGGGLVVQGPYVDGTQIPLATPTSPVIMAGVHRTATLPLSDNFVRALLLDSTGKLVVTSGDTPIQVDLIQSSGGLVSTASNQATQIAQGTDIITRIGDETDAPATVSALAIADANLIELSKTNTLDNHRSYLELQTLNTLTVAGNAERDQIGLGVDALNTSVGLVTDTGLPANSTNGSIHSRLIRVADNLTAVENQLINLPGALSSSAIPFPTNIRSNGTNLTNTGGALDVNISSGNVSITGPITSAPLNFATDSVTIHQPNHDDCNINANVQVNNADVTIANRLPVDIGTPTLAANAATESTLSALAASLLSVPADVANIDANQAATTSTLGNIQTQLSTMSTELDLVEDHTRVTSQLVYANVQADDDIVDLSGSPAAPVLVPGFGVELNSSVGYTRCRIQYTVTLDTLTGVDVELQGTLDASKGWDVIATENQTSNGTYTLTSADIQIPAYTQLRMVVSAYAGTAGPASAVAFDYLFMTR